MKLTIGENIRNYRKKNDLTQEELAARLGVTYQSVSRWENGTTYPDIELLPAISEMLAITTDELLGIPQAEKEKQAVETFDALCRECLKLDYDADRILSLLRDIRRNYLDSQSSYRPWTSVNGRAFRDPRILPEVRLLAEAYLARHPMFPHTLQTMAEIEDEEHLEEFLKKYTTSFDCSARALLFRRYMWRGDVERFEPERRYRVQQAFNTLFCLDCFAQCGDDEGRRRAEIDFMVPLLALIRRDAVDDRPDIWVLERMDLALAQAKHCVAHGKLDEALLQVESAVKLLEETMEITDEVLLPTSCRFLEGMEWRAQEDWADRDNNPDSPKERMIFIFTEMGNFNLMTCSCIFPSNYLEKLQAKEFEPLRTNSCFMSLCERVKMLIQTRPKEVVL